MPISNSDIAKILNKVADLLEIEGANQFRVRAYRNAAMTIEQDSKNVANMVKGGEDLTKLPGIGKDLAGKIKEIVETGSLEQLGKIEKRTSPGLAELLEVSGLGPNRVRTIHSKLGISNLNELKRAAEEGKIKNLPGFGQKTEQNILAELKRLSQEVGRIKLNVAEQVLEPLLDYLKSASGVKQVQVAGSYRCRKETVGDLDILVTAKKGASVIDQFTAYEDVEEVISKGKTRSTVILRSGMQVDLRVVPQVSYGAALLYFTGSKAHGVALRNIALDRGLKMNEYGLYRGQKRIGGKTEKQMYKMLELPFIPPELRENRGEIEAAKKGQLPHLVTMEDIRGDLHSHTVDSDGHASLEEMAKAAQESGYDYLAITDHSPHVAVAGGLDKEGLARQIEQIDHLNEGFSGFRLLKGIEVDILEDGSLDLPDSILKKLDVVICAVHSKFNLSSKEQTKRIIQAMDNPNFNILAHPTGRLLGKRQAYEVDMDHILEAALERGCYLEINAQPDRLDLNDVNCKKAKEMGMKLAISTDSHRAISLNLMRFGLGQARRGWLEAGDVLNTRSLNQLRDLLKR